jgi:hypothetical protein
MKSSQKVNWEMVIRAVCDLTIEGPDSSDESVKKDKHLRKKSTAAFDDSLMTTAEFLSALGSEDNQTNYLRVIEIAIREMGGKATGNGTLYMELFSHLSRYHRLDWHTLQGHPREQQEEVGLHCQCHSFSQEVQQLICQRSNGVRTRWNSSRFVEIKSQALFLDKAHHKQRLMPSL